MTRPRTLQTCIRCCPDEARRPASSLVSALSRRLRPSPYSTQSHPNPNTPSQQSLPSRPVNAPKPALPLRHIRENVDLYASNCIRRKYPSHSSSPARIATLFTQWKDADLQARKVRSKINTITKTIASSSADVRAGLLEDASRLKEELKGLGDAEPMMKREMDALALALPNLTSKETPAGDEFKVVGMFGEPVEQRHQALYVEANAPVPSHVEIGQRLGIVDFAAAATTSGHGWYFLLGDAAELEQALVQFALRTATKAGWTPVSPPSVVYGHVGAACGFQPRDGEASQIYSLSNGSFLSAANTPSTQPELCLAGTAEIPLAGMLANTTIPTMQLPIRRVAVSRCYRSEAGSYGAASRGLYRVHEFTKVELFAWTAPEDAATTEVFDEMLDLQTDILDALELRCRVLEMPAGDLGASAVRKCDIEAWFPSRADSHFGNDIHQNAGWGEVTSTSICTDYQTRRLGTRTPIGDKTGFPYTVNGTALAVPRIIAAILENGWDEESRSVRVPEALWPWMDKRVLGPAVV